MSADVELTIQIIKYAKSLLANPEAWIKGHLAGTARGTYCEPRDKMACRFCVAGAVDRAIYDVARFNGVPDQHRSRIMRLLKDAAGFYHLLTFASWNDHYSRTHEDVLNLFDKVLNTLGAT